MIPDKWKWSVIGGSLMPNGPSNWWIVDWDQRRTVAITTAGEQEDEDTMKEFLIRHIHTLSPDAREVSVSATGDLLSISNDVERDYTNIPYYPPFQALLATAPPNHNYSISRSDMREKDRLGPMVDLVSRPAFGDGSPKLLVFKYYLHEQFTEARWAEMNLWMRLPANRHIVPFDRVVSDRLGDEDVVVGFTTKFIPGGTLEDRKQFKLSWLRHLLSVVDDLNLKYGIVHQDIAPRNLLVGCDADDLLLFDFNYSACIGEGDAGPARNDVKGTIFTVYELITRDDSFRQKPFWEQNSVDVESMKEWAKHPDVELDNPVSMFRQTLDSWVKKRREVQQVTHYREAPEHIDWPKIPEPPVRRYTAKDGQGSEIVRTVPGWSTQVCFAHKMGWPYLTWQRPR
uniref:non-specific serine/threonine protein kinase n=1 Tax=Bionectria ochroleuca TaxID=29856 RepID=A0A8H7NKI5_BIOOC